MLVAESTAMLIMSNVLDCSKAILILIALGEVLVRFPFIFPSRFWIRFAQPCRVNSPVAIAQGGGYVRYCFEVLFDPKSLEVSKHIIVECFCFAET